MIRDLRENFMAAKPHWNAMGPWLPPWFKIQLRRLDPRLKLQFMVPDYVDSEGVDARAYPNGVWIICRALKETGWLLLHKSWTWALADARGLPRGPTPEDLALLRLARDLWQRNQGQRMAEELEASMLAIRRAKVKDSRQRLVEQLIHTMDKYGMRSHPSKSRIVVPQMAVA